MKALLIEIEGIINVASAKSYGAAAASLQALEDHGVSVTPDAFAEQVTAMSLAHADDPFVSAMWHFFRPHVAGRGYDRKHQLRAWRELLRARRG
ncbi:MAG: hypothetical protein KDB07_05160, partial [Planctomycetes bacterium]|nr:hypothetical protein [Planctomycetota bacterium]